MKMGSWIAREAVIAVVVGVVVVVGAQVLFNLKLGAAIGVAVAFVGVLASISLLQWRNAATDGRGHRDAAPQAPGAYTSDQFAQLTAGMSVAEADAVMGGGGQSSEDEDGGNLVRQYLNDDGSNVTVTFQDGSMSTKAMVGLE